MSTTQGTLPTGWDRPERWAMWVPWKPEIPDERRVELARHWLKFLGLEVTEERVAKIKRHVMFYHPLSPKGQVTNEIVLRDKPPQPQEYRARVPAVGGAGPGA